jgi:hypothetical protein
MKQKKPGGFTGLFLCADLAIVSATDVVAPTACTASKMYSGVSRPSERL